MNILLINHYALTPKMSGGTRHYDIARELIRRGHDVTIVASSIHYASFDEMRDYPPNCNFLIEIIENIRFVWLKTKAYSGNGIARVWNMLEFTWKLRLLSKLKVPTPDVIVGSSVHLFAVYGAYRLARHFKIPFVMEVRDIWPLTLVDMGMSKYHPFVLLLGRLEAFLYRHADVIITLLPRAVVHIEKFGVVSEKVVWISNGVDVSKFDDAKPSHRLRSDKFNVLYAGTLGMANNLEPIMVAAEKLSMHPGIEITLVGSGPLKVKLEQQAKQLSNVTIMEPVPKAEVPALLKEADVLFVGLKNLPLYRFGMSMNKVFDYMASAKPVVFAADVPDNPLKASDSGFIVAPNDPVAIENAVNKLYSYDECTRAAIGEKGKKYVKEHFDIEVIATKFESILMMVKNNNELNIWG